MMELWPLLFQPKSFKLRTRKTYDCFLSTHFSSITLLTFEVLVFPEIEQEVLVFVGKRGTDDGKIREIESKT